MAELRRAYADLALPEHDDEAVDWTAVARVVDRLGRAAASIGAVATDDVVPALRTLLALARRHETEVLQLNALVTEDPAP